MSEDENFPEVLHSGRVKFKAGLTSKWTTVYSTLCEGCLCVYTDPDCSNSIYSFDRGYSWISTKRTDDNSLFILNYTAEKSASSKTFLFDTESGSLLRAWLHAFKSAGWTSAITGEKFHYQRRNTDNFAARNNRSYRDVGSGGSLRGIRSSSAPTFFINGTSISSVDDIRLYRDRGRPGLKGRRAISSLFPGAGISTSGDATILAQGVERGSLNSTNSQTREESSPIRQQFENGDIDKKVQVRGSESKRETDFPNEEMTTDGIEDKFSPSSGGKIVRVSEVEINPVMNRNDRLRGGRSEVRIASSDHFDSICTENALNDKVHSKLKNLANTNGTYRAATRLSRFDHSKVFYDPSPDMKEKLIAAESRSRKTSCTRRGEHIRLSERDETEAQVGEDVGESKEDQISKLSNSIEVTNLDTGEQELISGPARRTSTALSEGDIDGESSNFHSGTPGAHQSYLESGYCSKESLATNESSENRKSSATIDEEINNNEAQLESNTEAKNHPQNGWQRLQECSTNGHETDRSMPSEFKNSPKEEERPNIAETERTFSDSVNMPARLGNRPNLLKLEKRSSMSQLLSQLRDRLPGRKSKGYKQQSRKENGKVKDSEMFLWHNSGKWKERWFMISDSCLVVYKDSLHESADFALDISNCRLDVPEENTEQGFLSFKLTEKDGRTHHFAAVSEESYQTLLTLLSKILQSSKHADVNSGLASDGIEEAEDGKLDDAIIPYPECEPFDKDFSASADEASKQEGADSGTDGDVSCFEGSDASNVGIEQYAQRWKDKVARRRKTSSALQQPMVSSLDETDGALASQEKGPVVSMRRSYRTVVASKSSPPTTRCATISVNRRNKSHDNRPIDYLNVDGVERRLVKNRYSVPDFGQLKMTSREDLYHRQRRSCIEEIQKLKEAHENNRYPEKSVMASKARTASLYGAASKSPIVDENGNHHRVDSLNQLSPNSPPRSSFIKVFASPATPRKSMPNLEHQNGLHTDQKTDLSESFNNPNSHMDVLDAQDDLSDDWRQQTLLMKRRNSLRLKKQFVNEKVKALREKVRQANAKTENPEVAEGEQNLAILENRLMEIDTELQSINLKVDLSATEDFKEEKKRNKQHFLKFKSIQKATTPVGSRKSNGGKDTLDNSATSPSFSPPIRKRSFSHSLKLFGHSGKRDSEGSGLNSTTASISSIESFHETQGSACEPAYRSAGNNEDRRLETQRSRKASSVSSFQESDEIDEKPDNKQEMSRVALSRIEDFEQFAVEITAKRVTDAIDV